MITGFQPSRVITQGAPTNWFSWKLEDRGVPYNISYQRANTGKFLNVSINADNTIGISINGSLAMVPQLAQISAIISGIISIFGLDQTQPEPEPQLKTVTIDPGVTLATLFGASQGINYLYQILQGKIQAIKTYIGNAVTSIQNLIKCALKNPLLAASILAKIIRQGWITIPPAVREAIIAARDFINKTIGLDIILYNPLAEFLKSLSEWLKYKFPPALVLPFIPYVPGCSPAFYSGRPPLSLLDKDPIVAEVTPQIITRPGGFTSKITLDVPTIDVAFGPGANPDLQLSDQQLANLIGSYDPYNFATSGVAGVILSPDLIPIKDTLVGSTSATRQVQDRLISASNKVVNDVTVLNKDISRSGFIPRSSPLDDLLCKPGER